MAQFGDICVEIAHMDDKKKKDNMRLYDNIKKYNELAKKQMKEEGFV